MDVRRNRGDELMRRFALLLLLVPVFAHAQLPLSSTNGGLYKAHDGQTCSADQFKVWADLSERKLKQCVDGVESDLGTGGGSGDITDVWGCTSGNCNALTAASGDTLNAASADSTAACKVGTTVPVTCTVGDCFFDSDATAGANLFGCTATDTWTAQGGGGSATALFSAVWKAASVTLSGAGTLATLDSRNGHNVLVFPDAVDTTAYFAGRAVGYAGGDINFPFSIMCNAATSGVVEIHTAIETSPADADSDDFDTDVETSCSCSGTAGGRTYCTATHVVADLDGLAVGNDFRLRFRRDGDGTTGTDSLTDDLQLVIVSAEEQP